MKLNKLKNEMSGREASKGNMPVFKPTKNSHRVRFIPVREDVPFREYSSVELGGTYYTLPFRKTKQGEAKDPTNYYTQLIQPVYGVDSNLYTSIKQKDKYIFHIVELDKDNEPIKDDNDNTVRVFFPSPGLAHTIIDAMMELTSVEPLDNPGVAFVIRKKTNSRTGFPDYASSSFEDDNFKLENWDKLCEESYNIKEVTTTPRDAMELALKNHLGNKVTLAYKTIKSTNHTTVDDSEDDDEYERKLLKEIESI